jgi:hypothetical protein
MLTSQVDKYRVNIYLPHGDEQYLVSQIKTIELMCRTVTVELYVLQSILPEIASWSWGIPPKWNPSYQMPERSRDRIRLFVLVYPALAQILLWL